MSIKKFSGYKKSGRMSSFYEKNEQTEITDMEIMQVLLAVGEAVEQIKIKIKPLDKLPIN